MPRKKINTAPAKPPVSHAKKDSNTQKQIVEVIKEVLTTIEVERPVLEGFELYAQLRDTGYPQGGVGQYVENVNGIDKAYIPHPHEIIDHFLGDPELWEKMRDGIIRTYLEVYEAQ